MTESQLNPDLQDTVAAVDLGSNSFHMIVAVRENGQLSVLDRLRDAVRLGGGLQPDKSLDEDARARALDSLSRIARYAGETMNVEPLDYDPSDRTRLARQGEN